KPLVVQIDKVPNQGPENSLSARNASRDDHVTHVEPFVSLAEDIDKNGDPVVVNVNLLDLVAESASAGLGHLITIFLQDLNLGGLPCRIVQQRKFDLVGF